MPKNKSRSLTQRITILKFYTPTCGPCKLLTSVFEDFKNENSQLIDDGILSINEVNALEEDPKLKPMSDLLVKQYKVTTVPTVVFVYFPPSDPLDPTSPPSEEPVYAKIVGLQQLKTYQSELDIYLEMLNSVSND
jgi:thiol-disulfide isomerase/thioredoxin